MCISLEKLFGIMYYPTRFTYLTILVISVKILINGHWALFYMYREELIFKWQTIFTDFHWFKWQEV